LGDFLTIRRLFSLGIFLNTRLLFLLQNWLDHIVGDCSAN
jgi:hypothetical protein